VAGRLAAIRRGQDQEETGNGKDPLRTADAEVCETCEHCWLLWWVLH